MSLSDTDKECKNFALRQISRMPSYYSISVKLICAVFYIFRLSPNSSSLLNRLILSLISIKKYEL
jgi:hypothetical protein